MLEIILVLILGIVIGMKVSSYIQLMAMKQLLQDLGIKDQDLKDLIKRNLGEEDQEPGLEVVEVKLEQHQGVIYAYRKDNDTFLGQGADRDSLIQRLNETMTSCKVIVTQQDGADLLQKNNTQIG
jgi:hypothetical protein